MSKSERIQLAGGALFVLLCVLAVVLLKGCDSFWTDWATKNETGHAPVTTNQSARRIPFQQGVN